MIDDKKENTPPACRFYVGTSGYAYGEWTDAGFYPPGTGLRDMLSIYADRFSVTELNYTWYQMPRAEAIERQLVRVPDRFLFAAKLTRTLTHEVDSANWPKEAKLYREGVSPLVQAGRLVAVLIQLPPSFGRTLSNRRHLGALMDELYGLPLAVEFRHRSWAHDRVFKELEDRKVALVSVDVPDLPGLFPSLDVVTSPELLYIRFHGRNVAGWRSGNLQKQFDYLYSNEQLSEWIAEKIMPMSRRAKKGVIFFNNHVRAQATENAGHMGELLVRQGMDVA